MIRIDRKKEPIPAALKGPGSLGGRERADNEKLARKGKHGDMQFSAYRDDTVKEALVRLFHRKCAYCENSMLGITPDDIEHYRPKGKVSIKDARGKLRFVDGYYWLAASWENLLTSCPDCNRPRTQDILNSARRVIGKANWFPLADEKKRARKPREVSREPRLLLNPCVDDPADHLVFEDDGAIAARKTGNKVSARGQATIEVCGLHRVELLRARARQGRYVMLAIRSVKQGDKEAVKDLRSMLSEEEPFSAFAAHLVRTQMPAALVKKLKLFPQ